MKIKFIFYSVLTIILSFPDQIFAQGQGNTAPPPVDNSSGITNPLAGKVDTISGLIQVILEGVVKIGIPIVALALVYSGFLFVAARGNPEKLSKAKNALLYSLIGAALLLGSWAVAQMISDTVLLL